MRYPMSDFDLSLIREFRSRPAFYDRNSALFKDKAFNAQAWQDISNILGYDVALLKDRMLQLRNRYNLEKRRLEQLAEENPGQPAPSPWPLYEHLGFLCEHIRSRRSFKRMLPRQASGDMNIASSMLSNSTDGGDAVTPMANGMLTVKLEHEEEGGVNSDSQSDISDDGTYEASANQLVLDCGATVGKQYLDAQQRQSISIRSLESMRSVIPQAKHQQQLNTAALTHYTGGNAATAPSTSKQPLPEKRRCLSTREQKYNAFGQFVASSLVEIPKQQALLLVEKFTSELVKVLIEKHEIGVASGLENNCSGGRTDETYVNQQTRTAQ